MFRSALEARWAEFFDVLGIEWEYEPIMLGGWMPDFRVAGKWLAEVKPIHLNGVHVLREPEFQKAMRSFETLLLGEGPGEALGYLVRVDDNFGLRRRFLVPEFNTLPVDLVPVSVAPREPCAQSARVWRSIEESGRSTWEPFGYAARTAVYETASEIGEAP